jgi:hypothetical protein
MALRRAGIGVRGCGRVGTVFLPSAIWVPSSAALSVFWAVVRAAMSSRGPKLDRMDAGAKGSWSFRFAAAWRGSEMRQDNRR